MTTLRETAQSEQEPAGNTITFMTRAIFNIVADHQEINGGYFIADGDVAAFVDRLAKVINSTFEPLKHKGSAPPQQSEQEPVATLFGSLPVYDVPTKQEPVAWMHNFIDEVVIAHRPVDLDRHPDRWTALYKDPTPCQTCEALARTVMMDQTSHDAPPQREWQGLTDEEIRKLSDDCAGVRDENEFIRAIEAKLKEKNSAN